MTAQISCSGLTGGRGSLVAFRDVDLAVDAGEVLALLGPNGAGKTTLLMTLAGLLPAIDGLVEVEGVALKPGRPAAANRAGVVLVPDNRCLFMTLSVEDNIRAAARQKQQPSDVLDVFPGLEKRWKVTAGALSGGEQQMLVLARAFVQRPKVLLVDELSMGLAPLIVDSLFLAVRQIADEHGCAVILVEQHVGLALEAADNAVVLSRGAIELRAPATELAADSARLEAAYFGVDESVESNPSP